MGRLIQNSLTSIFAPICAFTQVPDSSCATADSGNASVLAPTDPTKCSRAELLTDHRGGINCAGFSVVFRFATHRGRRRPCAPLSCCCPMVRAALSNGRGDAMSQRVVTQPAPGRKVANGPRRKVWGISATGCRTAGELLSGRIARATGGILVFPVLGPFQPAVRTWRPCRANHHSLN